MWKTAFAIIILTLSLVGCSKDEPASLAEEYPGEWQENSVSIARTLVKNNVRGCGYMFFKQRYDNSHQYLVYCSRDGKIWNAYIVWDVIEKVNGPYEQPVTIEPPF